MAVYRDISITLTGNEEQMENLLLALLNSDNNLPEYLSHTRKVGIWSKAALSIKKYLDLIHIARKKDLNHKNQ